MSESLYVINGIFADNGGIKSAYVIVKENIHGGLGTIFDKIIVFLKNQEANLYIHLVFQKSFAPLEWKKKVDVIKELMGIIQPWLSTTVMSQPPEIYTDNLEPIINGYVRSLGNFRSYMTNF